MQKLILFPLIFLISNILAESTTNSTDTPVEIRSEPAIKDINADNFANIIKEDKFVWVVGVINSTDQMSQEYMKSFREVPQDWTETKLGVVDLATPAGEKLFEGINMTAPSTIMFDDINPTWEIITQDRAVPPKELKLIMEYFIKDLENMASVNICF